MIIPKFIMMLKFMMTPRFMIPKSKRSQIGTTLTWFTAFLIIFFIMIIFISAVLVMSGSKKVFYGKDEIIIEKYSSDMRSQETLLNLLENKINYNGEKKIKQVLIELSSDDTKKEEIKLILENKFNEILNLTMKANECYVFADDYSGVDKEVLDKIYGMRGAGYVYEDVEKHTLRIDNFPKNTDSRVTGFVEKQKARLLEKSVELILLSENTKNEFGVELDNKQQIKIKFYIGGCM